MGSSNTIPGHITALIKGMSLAEKIAQISCVARTAEATWLSSERPATAAAELIRRNPHGVGQLGRPSQQRSVADSVDLTNAIQDTLIKQTRTAIPALFNEEGVHGHMADGATVFPTAIALASTWDVDLVERIYTAVAREVRARGSNYVYAPVLDLARDPRWGRIEETYGEDPHLAAEMGIAAVRGLQGTEWKIPADRVLACAKHFAGHGVPEGGINAAPLHAGERELREEHLAPFEALIAHTEPGAIMVAYHEIDGIPCHANPWLLRRVLREEWGFRGLVTSDGFGIPQLVTEHNVAEDVAAAGLLALQSGVDCEVPEPRCFSTLPQRVTAGEISESEVDRAVANVLIAKDRLGLLNAFAPADRDHATATVNSPEHRALALEAARRSMVLLQNRNVLLPLDPKRHSPIAVIGPNAADVHVGGYAQPGAGTSILAGIQRRFDRVVYAEGCRITDGQRGAAAWWQDDVIAVRMDAQPASIAEAVAVASSASVAILVIGGDESTAREGWAADHLGDRSSLELPGRQLDLVRAVAATGTPVVAVVMGGRPLHLGPIADDCDAVLQVWYPGQEGGNAVAEALSGGVNPSGKLPVCMPRGVGHIPNSYRTKPSRNRDYLFDRADSLFPFGHGLSYTTFDYGPPSVTPAEIGITGTAMVRVEVTNAGKRSGTEIVQCYLTDRCASVTRPVKALRGFAAIHLDPGESNIVTFELTPHDLSLLDADMKRIVEPGTFDVHVGSSSTDLRTTPLRVT